MNTKHFTTALAILATLLAAACTDAGCPEGSEEVDGICQAIDVGSDAGEGSVGPGGGSGSGGGDDAAMPAEPPDPMADEDAGTVELPGDTGPTVCGDVTCGDDAHCEQDGGTPACVCDAGFEGDGTDCSDVDECDDGTHDCDENAACANTAGGFACTCNAGYEGDGTDCSDVDECDVGSHDCDDNAACENTTGGFECTCNVGYEGDGKSCTRNPCEPRADPCDGTTTTCRDDAGEAVCDCLEGRGRCDGDDFACNTDLTADANHCGTCDYACAGSLTCGAGTCEQAVESLALGLNHSCGVDPDGQVLCWGNDDVEQLLRADPAAPTYEPAPASLGAATKRISAGERFGCALMRNDDVVCWGSNQYFRITPDSPSSGDGSTGSWVVGSDAGSIVRISSGRWHSCAFMGGFVECWGWNAGGVLGDTEKADPRSFGDRFQLDLTKPTDVAATWQGSCAVVDAGAVRCWGSFSETILDATSGLAITDAVAVSAGGNNTFCALRSTGRVSCWGENGSGQLGNPLVTDSFSDEAVSVTDAQGDALNDAVQIAVGGFHACALRESGELVCWGRRDRLGSGDSGSTAQRSFVTVSGIEDAVEVAAGAFHSCARLGTGQLMCWGDNADGQLGVDPSTTPATTAPVNVIGLP